MGLMKQLDELQKVKDEVETNWGLKQEKKARDFKEAHKKISKKVNEVGNAALEKPVKQLRGFWDW